MTPALTHRHRLRAFVTLVLIALLSTRLTHAQIPASGPSSSQVASGGEIPAPRKIHDVRPVYPEEAQKRGIQGTVIIEATIDPQGAVSDLRIIGSIPELDQAAGDAVRQWRFEPTLLNGKPVPVIMTLFARGLARAGIQAGDVRRWFSGMEEAV